ncbi:hypothetical protein HMPREF3067_00020 [Corynebacterium sp. HMSC04H06]|nr:hypothetical protein HMPREF3067_00020 [Corynebacterium sp. HMSC04H06]
MNILALIQHGCYTPEMFLAATSPSGGHAAHSKPQLSATGKVGKKVFSHRPENSGIYYFGGEVL